MSPKAIGLELHRPAARQSLEGAETTQHVVRLVGLDVLVLGPSLVPVTHARVLLSRHGTCNLYKPLAGWHWVGDFLNCSRFLM